MAREPWVWIEATIPIDSFRSLVVAWMKAVMVQAAVIQEVWPLPLGDGEHHLTVRRGGKQRLLQPEAPQRQAPGVAAGTEVAALAEKASWNASPTCNPLRQACPGAPIAVVMALRAWLRPNSAMTLTSALRSGRIERLRTDRRPFSVRAPVREARSQLILRKQSGEATGTGMAEHTGISLALLCHHADALVQTGIVRKRKEGQTSYWSVDRDALAAALRQLGA